MYCCVFAPFWHLDHFDAMLLIGIAMLSFVITTAFQQPSFDSLEDRRHRSDGSSRVVAYGLLPSTFLKGVRSCFDDHL